MLKSFVAGSCRRGAAVLVLLAVTAVLTGCRTVTYYAQAVRGQYQILARQEPVAKLLANPATPELLRRQLALTSELRTFAERELSLPVNGHYRRYADLGRPFVVWNVQAAKEFSLEAKSWWYPLVGSLEYRGFFSEARARDDATVLERKGYDVYVGGVSAYSTLGWFKDPLLNTFIYEPEPVLAETLFHELAHLRAFTAGDTDFNEAFATTVGEEGARRWLRARGDQALLTNYLAQLQRTREFVALTGKARRKLEALYGDWRNEEGHLRAARHPSSVPPEVMRARKQRILAELRGELGELSVRWGGSGDYAAWFETPPNNAQLNSVAAYYELVPAFERLLRRHNHDLEQFYRAVDRLMHLSRKDRHRWMLGLVEAGTEAVPRALKLED